MKASDQRLSGPARRFDIALVLDPVRSTPDDGRDPGEAAAHLPDEGHQLIHGIGPALRQQVVSAAIAVPVEWGGVHRGGRRNSDQLLSFGD